VPSQAKTGREMGLNKIKLEASRTGVNPLKRGKENWRTIKGEHLHQGEKFDLGEKDHRLSGG